MCIPRDNGEGDGRQTMANNHSVWVSFMFVALYIYILCSKLTNCFINMKQLSTMTAGDTSQTTPV